LGIGLSALGSRAEPVRRQAKSLTPKADSLIQLEGLRCDGRAGRDPRNAPCR
jgi:hypothetical protein